MLGNIFLLTFLSAITGYLVSGVVYADSQAKFAGSFGGLIIVGPAVVNQVIVVFLGYARRSWKRME